MQLTSWPENALQHCPGQNARKAAAQGGTERPWLAVFRERLDESCLGMLGALPAPGQGLDEVVPRAPSSPERPWKGAALARTAVLARRRPAGAPSPHAEARPLPPAAAVRERPTEPRERRWAARPHRSPERRLACALLPLPGGDPKDAAAAFHSCLLYTCAARVRVRALEVRAAAEARAFVGEAVVLRCWFRSSSPVSERLTIDWTFRPLAGGASEPIFHYQSGPYPAREGTFRERVSWAGDVAKQDASIAIASPTMEDNGTFSCSVKNPPDVQHDIPQTVLRVTQRGTSFQLSLAGLLSMLVFLPSAIVVALLLVRMGRKSGALNSRKKFACKKSSIEVVDETEQPGCVARLAGRCLQCLDTDEEDPY
ncbi:myelin protein zero-like protein 3 [Eublepharis macularius]|uniref:Myelin protein zero-like protein 3 n=1 Tax=Eublepharis macularius TaxID=481883 RepID=A0AA97LG15_EUBMA|nr:myelin protein zero-like protein 3 [Eublepharis macularius]